MSNPNGPCPDKSSFHGLIREITQLAAEFKKGCEEVRDEIEQAIPFEDLPIASTYPRELFEDEAKRLGIDMDAIGEQEAIKRIVKLHEQEMDKLRPLRDERRLET